MRAQARRRRALLRGHRTRLRAKGTQALRGCPRPDPRVREGPAPPRSMPSRPTLQKRALRTVAGTRRPDAPAGRRWRALRRERRRRAPRGEREGPGRHGGLGARSPSSREVWHERGPCGTGFHRGLAGPAFIGALRDRLSSGPCGTERTEREQRRGPRQTDRGPSGQRTDTSGCRSAKPSGNPQWPAATLSGLSRSPSTPAAPAPPPAGRSAPGRASRRRSRGRPCGRSGSSSGRHRARRRRRS